jgi:hypothetical protein
LAAPQPAAPDRLEIRTSRAKAFLFKAFLFKAFLFKASSS